MKHQVKNHGLLSARAKRTLKISPAARAIRAALAISATMLALAGNDAALAGSCSYSAATNTETCGGAFTNLPGSSFTPVHDLTLVVDAGSTINPLAGDVGIRAADPAWSGNVTVTSSADINSTSAPGIFAFTYSDAVISNFGDIATDVAASSFKDGAIYVGAVHDVTFVNGGNITASTSYGGFRRAYAVQVHAGAGVFCL
jgi:hypothetical protein